MSWFSGDEGIKSFKVAHANSDVDQGDKSLHHTLGEGPNQAAKGSVFKAFRDTINASINALNSAITNLTSRIVTLETDSDWQTVGAVGKPAFQNGWVNFGSGFQVAQYRKVGKVVYIRGLVKSGTLGQTIFTLPVGYRPAVTGDLLFVGASSGFTRTTSGASAGTAHTHTYQLGEVGMRVNVKSDGTVFIESVTGLTSGYFSLSCISFLVD